MKIIHTSLALAVLCLAGGWAVQYVMTNSLHNRVTEQGEEIRRVREETGEKLTDHEARLREVEIKSAANAAEIDALTGRLAGLNSKVGELETAGSEDRERIATLEQEIAMVKRRMDELADVNKQYLDDLEGIRSELSARDSADRDLQLRLIEVEKRLGIERPNP